MKITEITTWSYSLHVVIFHLYIIASERMVIIMKPDYIVFPDASVKLSGKKRYGGYGVVVLERKSKQYLTEQNELHGKTVPYLEGYAMYRGLQLVSRFHKGNDARSILVVSDSKTVVDAFNIWMHRSWNMSDYENWKKRDGTPVQNQKLYRMILDWSVTHSYKLKVVHIRSHTERNPALRDTIRKKLQTYKVRVNDTTLDTIIRMNRLADQLANDAATYYKDTDGILERLIPIDRGDSNDRT